MKKTKHHIISEVYQRNFMGDDGKIYYLMPSNKIVPGNPSDMLKEEHYNTVKGSLFIEDIFSNTESYFGEVIRRVKNREKLTKDDKIVLSIYTSMIFNRNRVRRDKMKNFAEKILNRTSEIEGESSFKYSDIKSVDDNYKNNGKISLNDFKESYQNFNEVFSASSMDVSLSVWEIIYKMKWRFLLSPDNLFFLSSDNPVNLCRPLAENKYGFGSHGAVSGLRHSDVELTFPLTKNVALLAGWLNSDDLNYVDVPDNIVNQINYITVRSSEVVFSGEKQLLEIILNESIIDN